MIPVSIEGQTYRNHSLSASGEVFSVDIPLVGTISAVMKYDLDFEIIKPSKIQAGKSDQILLSPKQGKLTTSFYLNGNLEGSVTKDIPLGSTNAFTIPSTFVGQIFAKPTLLVFPQVSGPASTPIREAIEINSMTTQRFTINTQSEIGSFDSITVSFPMAVVINYGGKINFYVTDYTILEDRLTVEIKPMINEKIPLEKFVNTNLSMNIRDGSKIGYINVNPKVTDSSGRQITSNSISIYVDGAYKIKIKTNSWSQDIYTKSGSHNIKAEFPQTTSTNNKAIIYKSSSDLKSFTVKSPPPKQTSSSSPSTNPSRSNDLTCGKGTHEEKGQCVSDGLFGGGCLIATATYGSELAPQVQTLRELRDGKLLQTESGTYFMDGFNDFYYSFSPVIADYERENPVFREAVKLVITPMITSLSILNYVDMDSEAEVMGYGISLILLNVGMYFVAPAIVIVGIKKKF